MLRFWIGSIIVIVFQTAIYSQYDFPQLPMEIIKARIHSQHLANENITYKRNWKYIIMEGKITSQNYDDLITEYDKWGRIKEAIHMDKSGKTAAIDIYDYTPNNLLNKITFYHPTGQTLGGIELKYNSQGFLIEEVEYDQYNYVKYKVLYQINYKDTIITENYFDAQQTLAKVVRKGYSNFVNGKLKWVEELDTDSNLLYRKELEYHNDTLFKETFYNSNGEHSYYLQYAYNPHGKLANIVKHYPRGTHFTHYTCIFNDMGLLAGEIKYVKNEKAESYYKYTYH